MPDMYMLHRIRSTFMIPTAAADLEAYVADGLVLSGSKGTLGSSVH